MRAPTPRGHRSGLTLIEMMIAIVLFTLVFGIAVPFFRVQGRSVAAAAGRLDAMQNARYAQNAIDRDLRIAGTGVMSSQPLIVQAGANAITFNGDLVTTDSADPAAVYYDPSVDSSLTMGMTTAGQVSLPLSAISYPETTYTAQGLPSTAETISYWVVADSAAALPNEYSLYRRVNNGTPRLITRNVLIPPGTAFFQYFTYDSATSRLDSIPTADLPLFHSAAIHGSAADTGSAARVDLIRDVRVYVSGVYRDPRTNAATVRTVVGSTNIVNAGMLHHDQCGDPPASVTNTAVTYYAAPPAVQAYVEVSWNASPDQDTGEKDVARYMIFRRATGSSQWGSPIGSLAASRADYTYDVSADSGSWDYGVVAQDCTPANSALTSASVIVP